MVQTSSTQRGTTFPFTTRAYTTLERFLPGLQAELAAHPLSVLEAEGNPGVGLFKEAGGGGVLVPSEYGGAGATAREAVEVQYALGCLAPSTAVAATMHQFTIATLVEMLRETEGLEAIVLEAIATQNLLVASAFAEGKPGGNVLEPTMTLVESGPDYELQGVKKPCSLSASMDMITVSVKMPDPSEQLAVALIGADADGIRIEPFWESPVLGGAETAAVVFEGVPVAEAALTYIAPSSGLDRVQVRGYVWFQLCIAAAYVGIAAGFAERLPEGRADDTALVTMAAEMCSSLAMLDSVAERLDAGEGEESLLAESLIIRFAAERAIQRSTSLTIELLGVTALARQPESALVFAASRALSYHPPSRRRTERGLAAWLHGADLDLVAQ